MNKKANTVLFLLAATIVNLLILAVMLLILIIFFSWLSRFIPENSVPFSWLAIIVSLFGSIAATFFIYSKLVKWVANKWKLEDYIDPIFKPRRR